VNLNQRVTRLEQHLAAETCSCPTNSDLSWPGHQPHRHCTNCGGQRLVFQLDRNPRQAEPVIRGQLPLLVKAYDGERLDFATLTDAELEQLKRALQLLEIPPRGSKA
jgi:hypothetical protein